jgi:hypothetical protein
MPIACHPAHGNKLLKLNDFLFEGRRTGAARRAALAGFGKFCRAFTGH